MDNIILLKDGNKIIGHINTSKIIGSTTEIVNGKEYVVFFTEKGEDIKLACNNASQIMLCFLKELTRL